MIRFSALLGVIAALLSGVSFGQSLKSGTVPEWGELINPKKSCLIQPLDKSLKMTLSAGVHDLSFEFNRMSAPRVLQSVAGDFNIQVKVAGVAHPVNKSLVRERRPFCSAGLLIWQNEQNYIRLERASLNIGGTISTYASWELRQDGKFVRAGRNDELPLSGAVTWLRITRKGDNFIGAASPDGQQWSELPAITLQAAELKAGILAINDTPIPFTPVFSEFSLGSAAAP